MKAFSPIIITLFFFILVVPLYECEVYNPCSERQNDVIRILDSGFVTDNVIDWGVEHTGLRRVLFRFKKQALELSIMQDLRIERICTSSAFYAEIKEFGFIHLDPNNVAARVNTYKILAFYPAPSPSNKVFYEESNRQSGEAIHLLLPKASLEYHDESWVELGLELKFTGLQNASLEDDLELLRSGLNYLDFRVEYVEL